jgi:hypothetical protein
MEIKEVVKEKYGEAARRVTNGESNGCCGSAPSSLGCVDPITSNLYAADETGQAEVCGENRRTRCTYCGCYQCPCHTRVLPTCGYCWSRGRTGIKRGAGLSAALVDWAGLNSPQRWPLSVVPTPKKLSATQPPESCFVRSVGDHSCLGNRLPASAGRSVGKFSIGERKC